MSEYTTELVTYHEVSPDPQIPGCMNTTLEEDGVVFQGVEPMIGSHLFIGRTSLIDAVALLFNTTPEKVITKLEGKAPATRGTKAEIK